jgi:hypothetical protein
MALLRRGNDEIFLTIQADVRRCYLTGRLLRFDKAAARDDAGMAAARRRSGRPISEPDARSSALWLRLPVVSER